MKHYVVSLVWASNVENDSTILSVAHSFAKAKEVFADNIIAEKELALKNSCVVYEDND